MCSDRRWPRLVALALAVAAPTPARAERPYYVTVGLEAGAVRLAGDHGTYGATGFGTLLVLGVGLRRVSFEWHVGQRYALQRPRRFVAKDFDGGAELASYVVRYRPWRGLALTAGIARTSLPVVDAAVAREQRLAGIGAVVGVGAGVMRRGGFFTVELRAARGLTELPAAAYLVPDGAGGYATSTDDLAPWFVTATLAVRSNL